MFLERIQSLIQVQTLPYAEREQQLRLVEEELQLSVRVPFDPSWLELKETILLEIAGMHECCRDSDPDHDDRGDQ